MVYPSARRPSYYSVSRQEAHTYIHNANGTHNRDRPYPLTASKIAGYGIHHPIRREKRDFALIGAAGICSETCIEITEGLGVPVMIILGLGKARCGVCR